jgi:hypothetical protein
MMISMANTKRLDITSFETAQPPRAWGRIISTDDTTLKVGALLRDGFAHGMPQSAIHGLDGANCVEDCMQDIKDGITAGDVKEGFYAMITAAKNTVTP